MGKACEPVRPAQVGVELKAGENPGGQWATAALPEVFKGQPEAAIELELLSDIERLVGIQAT